MNLKAKRILEQRKKTLIPVSLFSSNFPQQEAFIKDPAKLKALFCTRRAAKSFTAGLYMVHEALSNPGCNCLFIGLTRSSAKSIIWKDILKTINRRYKLNAKFNQSELSMTFPNGSVIKITGVDAEESEMNKLLGGKYRLVCIDEASMYTINVSTLVYGVLKPATIDPNANGDRGTICLMGTSSNFTRGLFYDITTSKETGWSLHQWTAFDNPHVAKEWQEELDEIATKRPLYMETPQFKQWYLNQWVVDEEKLVYRFNETRNLYKEFPKLSTSGWTYILGVDLGWEDATAFVLTAYHEHDPHLYIVDAYSKSKMSFDQVVEKVNKYIANTSMSPSKVIIDGAAKQGVESMRQRSSIPFVYTDKQGKVDFIEMLNADLIQGKIKLSSGCKALQDEMMSLVWKTDGDRITLPKKEHPALPNHLCDALLYAWRMGFHHTSTTAPKVLPVGSKEWYATQADNIWQRERERLVNEANQTDWAEQPEDWSY